MSTLSWVLICGWWCDIDAQITQCAVCLYHSLTDSVLICIAVMLLLDIRSCWSVVTPCRPTSSPRVHWPQS